MSVLIRIYQSVDLSIYLSRHILEFSHVENSSFPLYIYIYIYIYI